MKKALNLREYWDAVGTENMEKIIHDVDSTLAYFRMMRYGVKKPSGDMALKIIEAAGKHTAPYLPDLELLLRGVPRAGVSAARALEPTKEFTRSRSRFLEKQQESSAA